MLKKYFGLGKTQHNFYEEYALNNQLDFVQLCLLDILQSGGGRLTWIMLNDALPFTRRQLDRAAAELASQDLLKLDFDGVEMTDYAPCVVQEILNDLHTQYRAKTGLEPSFDGEDSYFSA